MNLSDDVFGDEKVTFFGVVFAILGKLCHTRKFLPLSSYHVDFIHVNLICTDSTCDKKNTQQ